MKTLKQYLISIVSLAMALAVFFFPLQQYFSLSRVQHYGLAVFVWGLGFMVQWVWTYPESGKWARWSYLSGGLYLTSLGLIFYSHPWMDPHFAVQTERQINFRMLVGYVYTALAFPISLVWLQGFQEKRAPRPDLSSKPAEKE